MRIQVIGNNCDLTWNMDHGDMKLTGTIDGDSICRISDSEYYFSEMAGIIQAVQEKSKPDSRQLSLCLPKHGGLRSCCQRRYFG